MKKIICLISFILLFSQPAMASKQYKLNGKLSKPIIVELENFVCQAATKENNKYIFDTVKQRIHDEKVNELMELKSLTNGLTRDLKVEVFSNSFLEAYMERFDLTSRQDAHIVISSSILYECPENYMLKLELDIIDYEHSIRKAVSLGKLDLAKEFEKNKQTTIDTLNFIAELYYLEEHDLLNTFITDLINETKKLYPDL